MSLNLLLWNAIAFSALAAGAANSQSGPPMLPGPSFAVGDGSLSIAIGDLNGDGATDLATANWLADTVSVLLGTGGGSFAAASHFVTGNRPRSIAIGDLDGDGALDLATANEYSDTVSVLRGTGSGSFGAATPLAVGNGPVSVAIGDLDGDGALDLATANQHSNTVSVSLGMGSGSFAAASHFAVGECPVSVAIADLDGDVAPDLVTANEHSHSVSVLLGMGGGSFAAASHFAVGDGAHSVAVGDLDGDDVPDLATANVASGTVSVLLGTGAGSFSAASHFAVGGGPRSIAIGDLDGDGALDIATANEHSDNVSVLLGMGNGSFAAAFHLAVGNGPYSVAIGDLDGDGPTDLATANWLSGTVSVLNGAWGGSFTAASHFVVGDGPYSVAVGDLDGDGLPDLATANEYSDTVTVLMGTGNGDFAAASHFTVGDAPRSVAMGDVDGDGALDLVTANERSDSISVLLGTGAGGFSAASHFTVGDGPRSIAIGDLDGDGALDIATANEHSDNVSVLLGMGNGSFAAAFHLAVGNGPYSIAIGDLDGDGAADLATANWYSHTVSVLLGTGDARFAAASHFAVGEGPRSVAISDLDEDSNLDLATANYWSATASILLGNGSGSFGAASHFAVGDGAASVALSDLDGDSAADLVTANWHADTVSVLFGTGAGSFGAAYHFAVGEEPRSVAIGDLNGDGAPDLATANWFSDTVSVLFSQIFGPPLFTGSIAGYVFLGTGSNRIPMKGVDVEVLEGDRVLHSRKTGGDGSYGFGVVSPGSYTLRATIEYGEPATGRLRTIHNYPAWEPQNVFDVVPGHVTQVNDISFPWPILLQGGVALFSLPGFDAFGGGIATWTNGSMDFLVADPASEPSKHEHRLPAFLCFPMPAAQDFPGEGYDKSGTNVFQHSANADALREWIQEQVVPALAKYVPPDESSQLMVSIVAHSMGGLIARAYVKSDSFPRVARVVTLDAPHGGTTTAPLVSKWGLTESALNGYILDHGLYEEEVSGWNAANTDLPKSPPWLLYSCDDNTIVLPDESAHGQGRLWTHTVGVTLPPDPILPPTWEMLTWLEGIEEPTPLGTGHTEIQDQPQVLQGTAHFLAYGSLGDSDGPVAPATIAGRAADPGVAFGLLAAAPGSSSTVTVSFDSNPVVEGTVTQAGAGAHYEITHQGTPLPLEDLVAEAFAPDAIVNTFKLTAAPVGPIEITLHAGPLEAAAAEWSFRFENGRRLKVTALPGLAAGGGTVQVLAHVEEQATGTVLAGTGPASSAAVLHLPDGTELPLELFDDGLHGDGFSGDGVFGAAYAGTAQEGRYAVEVHQSVTAGEEVVQRSGTTSFAVSPTGATFQGPPVETVLDPDGDGLYDSLQFAFNLAFTKSGSYRVLGDLEDTAGDGVVSLSTNVEYGSGKGAETVTLVAKAPDIVEHGVTGPWTLTRIRLVNLDAGALPVATAPDHPTQAYSLESFEPPDLPKVHAILPDAGPFGGGNEVVIFGSGLSEVSRVQVGGSPAPFALQDDQSIRVTIPSGGILPLSSATVGQMGKAIPYYSVQVSITVTTPWGTVVESDAYTYTSKP